MDASGRGAVYDGHEVHWVHEMQKVVVTEPALGVYYWVEYWRRRYVRPDFSLWYQEPGFFAIGRAVTMRIKFHSHARDRLAERGTNEEEVLATVETGERFEARFGRVGFRRNLPFYDLWRGKRYRMKQIEAYVIRRYDGWLVISVVTRYF